MGYRLNVSDGKNKYYNTKLYGYKEETKLKSYKFLQQINKIEDDMFWCDGIYNEIELTAKEFKNFAKYYLEDLKKYSDFNHDNWLNEEEIPALLNSKENKKIWWD